VPRGDGRRVIPKPVIARLDRANHAAGPSEGTAAQTGTPGPACNTTFKRSKFLDIFERSPDGTICIYDHKTGQEGLTVERMMALAATAARIFPDRPITTILVIEMRPR